MTTSVRRLGILGGTFDPIHLGHLRAAEEAREALELERVLFVPAADPWHRPAGAVASPRERLTMVGLAVAGHPAFAASAIEIERSGPSYTVDTLAALRALEPEAALHLLLGFDAYREIATWHEAERIFELTSVVVVRRPPEPLEPTTLPLPVAARGAFCYLPDTRRFTHTSGTTLSFLSIAGLDVSSTEIRARLREGRSIRYLVADAVALHIATRRLYAPEPTA